MWRASNLPRPLALAHRRRAYWVFFLLLVQSCAELSRVEGVGRLRDIGSGAIGRVNHVMFQHARFGPQPNSRGIGTPRDLTKTPPV